MSTTATLPLAYRCNKCWQMTTASSDQVGQSVPCICCSSPVVVPEASPKTIKAGEEFATTASTCPPPQIEFGSANLTDEQIAQLARQNVEQEIRQAAHDSGSFEVLACSRWKRLIGTIIDSIAAFASIAVGIGLAMLLGSLGGDNRSPALLVVMILVPAMLAICQCYLIAVEGRTIGKYCVKSKIVNIKGHPPGFFQGIVMRNVVVAFLGMIPFFGLIDACWIFNEPKRCLHDYIAGTFVINA